MPLGSNWCQGFSADTPSRIHIVVIHFSPVQMMMVPAKG
jgi:hypothetical protein